MTCRESTHGRYEFRVGLGPFPASVIHGVILLERFNKSWAVALDDAYLHASGASHTPVGACDVIPGKAGAPGKIPLVRKPGRRHVPIAKTEVVIHKEAGLPEGISHFAKELARRVQRRQ